MIAVIDFGGQYAHLIATRVRAARAFTRIYPSDVNMEELKKAKGIIFSGGPQSVFAAESPKIDSRVFRLRIPILAICYGHQLLAHTLGGKVGPCQYPEYGPATLEIEQSNSPLFKNIPKKIRVWMSHHDEVQKLPDAFKCIASTSNCSIAAMQNTKKNFYSLQLHPEVVHTEKGEQILKNFVDICGERNTWNLKNFIDKEIENIKEKIGKNKVFLLVSGGVDSTVAFALLEKALGKSRVFGVFIDTGLLRLNERGNIKTSLIKAGITNLHVADASKFFIQKLEGIYNPEQKRNIIGVAFLEIQKEIVQRLKLNPDQWLLGQGTIYPDTIESGGTKNAEIIKTHHNRIPEIQVLIDQGKIIEPLKNLYKDEVRKVGEYLNVPLEIVNRHPFPGPGLGVRILCSNISTSIDEYKFGTFDKKKYELQVLPLRSVGVQGDQRTYNHPVVLYTKTWEVKDLEETALHIVNSFPDINRAMVCLSHETKQDFKIAELYITPERIKKLQQADFIAQNILFDYEKKNNPVKKVWQFPVVLLPLVNEKEEEAVVLRPIFSVEAMTAEFADLPKEILDQMTQEIMQIPGVGSVFFDITHKPPGTIEWE